MRDDQYYQRLNQIREKYGYAHTNPAQRPPTPRVESSLSSYTTHQHLPYSEHAQKPKVEAFRMEEKPPRMYEQPDYSRQNYTQLQSAPRSPYGREPERILGQAEGKVDHNKQIERMLAAKKSKNMVIPLKVNPPPYQMQEEEFSPIKKLKDDFLGGSPSRRTERADYPRQASQFGSAQVNETARASRETMAEVDRNKVVRQRIEEEMKKGVKPMVF